ncbi:MAG: glycosyltransferase family 2 protein [Tepidisphaeraceae bacterium]
MVNFAITLFVVFLLMSAGQLLLAWIYTRRFRGYRLPKVPDTALPRAAIILCLRGEDPFLENCLERLARQNYPRFSIRIVLDGPDDPARRRVEQWVARYRELPVSVEVLKDPFATCTLYCSSIHQAVRGLDDSIEAIAFVNADTMVHADWLRALMTPLLDERIGAVTGNRWYFPAAGCMGSLVRYVQNATAVLVMYFLDLIWGGSLALKRQVFGHARFLDQLRVSSCEDCAVHTVLKATGLRLSFSPAAMMVNR